MEKERGITIANVEREAAIEDIAWRLFKRKLGLSINRELTPEEKKSIINNPSFQIYMDEAMKIYEKKQKALSNKKYPIIDVPASGKKSWMGGAYTLCFVYSKYKGNFVLRGYYKEVEEYLKNNYTHYFCNFSLWYEGFSRNIWKFWKENVGIFQPDRHYLCSNRKYKIRPYSDLYADDEIKKVNSDMELQFKRLPKKWIPEFDKF